IKYNFDDQYLGSCPCLKMQVLSIRFMQEGWHLLSRFSRGGRMFSARPALLFHSRYLGDSPFVTSPFERCADKFLDHLMDRDGIFDSAAESNEVGVIVGFGHFSAEKIEKERAADAFDFVCGNRDSDACAAQKNPETVSAVFKLRASSERD